MRHGAGSSLKFLLIHVKLKFKFQYIDIIQPPNVNGCRLILVLYFYVILVRYTIFFQHSTRLYTLIGTQCLESVCLLLVYNKTEHRSFCFAEFVMAEISDGQQALTKQERAYYTDDELGVHDQQFTTVSHTLINKHRIHITLNQ